MEEQGVPSQRILAQIFSLPARDAEWVERNVATLQKMGIGVENFGANSFRVDTLPAFLEIADAAGFLRKVIDELKTTSRSSSPLRLGEDMIAKTVCRHAVKANDPLRYPEIEKLIRDLLACDLPYCCPHGRPTMIQISHANWKRNSGEKSGPGPCRELELLPIRALLSGPFCNRERCFTAPFPLIDFRMSERRLVTGAGGFIGGHFVANLLGRVNFGRSISSRSMSGINCFPK